VFQVGRGKAIGEKCSFYPGISSRLPRPYDILNETHPLGFYLFRVG
jgi:hypothetical protein